MNAALPADAEDSRESFHEPNERLQIETAPNCVFHLARAALVLPPSLQNASKAFRVEPLKRHRRKVLRQRGQMVVCRNGAHFLRLQGGGRRVGV